nr:hypothetical protein OG781_04560 [Streptomyces sp. NBC_00830]
MTKSSSSSLSRWDGLPPIEGPASQTDLVGYRLSELIICRPYGYHTGQL